MKSCASEGFFACLWSSSIRRNFISRTNSRTPASNRWYNWCGSLLQRSCTFFLILNRSGLSLFGASFQQLLMTRWYNFQTCSLTSIQAFRNLSISLLLLVSITDFWWHDEQSQSGDNWFLEEVLYIKFVLSEEVSWTLFETSEDSFVSDITHESSTKDICNSLCG